jgi:hypothetical protein
MGELSTRWTMEGFQYEGTVGTFAMRVLRHKGT